ncbi:MAG: hypothetical protein K6G26_12595 [Lachnospiraceae bacterium]|nr:hypothetical protein [Lachnospiraceae bacterium]
MINKKKVRVMTNLAIYEKHNEADIIISRFYKNDYIRLNMLKTAVNVTVAYLLIIFMLAIYNCEELITEYEDLNYVFIIRKVIIIYAVLLCAFLFISYVFYNYKYKDARKRLKLYYKKLRYLENISK